MSTFNIVSLIAMSTIALCVSALAVWEFWVRNWMPKPRNHYPRWKRQLWREWRKNPLPAPRSDLIIRTWGAE